MAGFRLAITPRSSQSQHHHRYEFDKTVRRRRTGIEIIDGATTRTVAGSGIRICGKATFYFAKRHAVRQDLKAPSIMWRRSLSTSRIISVTALMPAARKERAGSIEWLKTIYMTNPPRKYIALDGRWPNLFYGRDIRHGLLAAHRRLRDVMLPQLIGFYAESRFQL